MIKLIIYNCDITIIKFYVEYCVFDKDIFPFPRIHAYSLKLWNTNNWIYYNNDGEITLSKAKYYFVKWLVYYIY